MKKVILAIAAMVLTAGMISAQDMAQATELYNNGANAISEKNWTAALDYFQKALEMGQTIGEEANEIVTNCKNAIPSVCLQIAQDLIESDKLDEAEAKLADVVKVATEYGNEEVAEKAKSLVPAMWLQKGAEALKVKDFATAAPALAKSLAADPANGKTALYLGQALSKLGKVDEALEAFNKAAENGEADAAKAQCGNMFLSKASALLKGGKYADAIKAAEQANSYVENAKAFLVIVQASQKLGKNAAAISNFEKYLQLMPEASNANTINFTLGALYQGAKNNAKAVEYYKKVVNDPKFGAQAKQLIASLSK